MPSVYRGLSRTRRVSADSIRSRHDDLGLACRVVPVLVAYHGDHQGRRALPGDRAERRHRALEARVDRLEAVPGGPLVDDGQASRELVLRDHDLVDPVTVEVHGERLRFRGVDVAAAAPLDVRHPLELPAAAAARRRRAPRVLRVDRDPEAVVLVDECERPLASLARDVGEGGPGGPERAGHADARLGHELAVLEAHPLGLALFEEAVLREGLGPQGLLDPVAVRIHGEQDVRHLLDQHRRLPPLRREDERVQQKAGVGVIAIDHDVEPLEYVPASRSPVRSRERSDRVGAGVWLSLGLPAAEKSPFGVALIEGGTKSAAVRSTLGPGKVKRRTSMYGFPCTRLKATTSRLSTLYRGPTCASPLPSSTSWRLIPCWASHTLTASPSATWKRPVRLSASISSYVAASARSPLTPSTLGSSVSLIFPAETRTLSPGRISVPSTTAPVAYASWTCWTATRPRTSSVRPRTSPAFGWRSSRPSR